MPILSVTMMMIMAAGHSEPWLDTSLPIPARVKLLMDQMTLTERARQTYAVHNIPQFVGAFKKKLGESSFGSLKLSAISTRVATEQVAIRNQLQAYVVNSSRLHIPVSFHNEILLSAAPQATNFPLPVALGASFNESLVQSVHEVLAVETRATGVDVGYAPEVNLYVDARFGRLQEGFSEDPFLSSSLGVAAVRGLQGDGGSGPGTPLPKARVASLAKHYLAYGKAAGGQNVGMTETSERTLREIFLAPWRAMIKQAGLRALMPAHQLINDVPVHGNAWVGQTLLRDELNFSLGLSVSDCSDVGVLIDWGLAANSTVAAAVGLEAGVDMDNMCGKNDDGTWTYEHIEEAVAAGFASEKRVNESCSRVLAQKFAAGLFEDPNAGVVSDNATLNALLDSPVHRQLALEASEQGIVLLQNRDRALPLTPKTFDVSKGVALIGESAACGSSSTPTAPPQHPSDPDHCKAQLNMLGKTQHHVGNVSVVTVAEAIARAGSPLLRLSGTAVGASIDSATDEKVKAAAVALAAKSGLALLVLGDSEHSCAEWGDRSSLALPSDQPELLRRVLETGVPTVLLLIHGRPVSFEVERSSNRANHSSLLDFPNLRAVATAWRPGEEGGTALVNLLLGQMTTGAGGPSGRLAQAWPRSAGQIGGPSTPWFQHRNGKWISNKKGAVDPLDGYYHYDPYVDAPSTPAFPFGFGLSFGAVFEYSDVTANVLPVLEEVVVQVTLHNHGTTDGVEVVQVYATAPLDNIVRYWKRLVAFKKVLVKAGEALRVTVEIDADDLAVYTTSTPGAPTAGTRTVLRGTYSLSVGGSSVADLAKTTFSL